MERIIVSRHPAAVQFIARQVHPTWHAPVVLPDRVQWWYLVLEPQVQWWYLVLEPQEELYDEILVKSEVTASDVDGKVVYGNIPMHLAARAAEAHAVEFDGVPPRGGEYGLEDMVKAGARLTRYMVLDQARVEALREAAHSDGYGPDPRCLVHFNDEPSPYK